MTDDNVIEKIDELEIRVSQVEMALVVMRNALVEMEFPHAERLVAAAERGEDLSQPGLWEGLLGGVGAVERVSKLEDTSLIRRLQPMFEAIRRSESQGNYNAYFGKVANSNAPRFVTMDLDEVLSWQDSFVERRHSPSSAVGAYQIIRKTLRQLILDMQLTGKEIFNEGLQDRFALRLLKGRGLIEWLEGKIGIPDFINEVAKEWAGLPNMTGRSHYGDDGLNKATLRLADWEHALRQTLEKFVDT